MIGRRAFLFSASAACASGGALVGMPARAAPATSYAAFLAGVRAEALRNGLSASVVGRALALQAPNDKVLQLDRHQPEFTLTWAQYRQRVLTEKKIADGRSAAQARRALLAAVGQRYGVDVQPLMGIWGLESAYGTRIGTFRITDALATLAYDGRRASFFRSELMNALRILDHGDVEPERMIGSYAGAMGQPQFMPSAYLRYAVDYTGTGRRDIWTSEPDVFASIANYLGKCGWVAGEPWGQAVSVPAGLAQERLGRDRRMTLTDWMGLGVRRLDGTAFSRGDITGAVIRPDGPGGEAFMVYRNFSVIRRYNPSDFYALAVGLLGRDVT
ncbi:lytic murein transglycosylase [Gluconacetobacter azotocaptans]|uniref:Lytic murein transglycosylase n=1 Tax=Gluconacetobacter azotocaptans TaxID=142834 RepID=A0A7W4JTR6_9PROT|nr:lytic murein transglycosylase [Gluconacetobacter azotocaptans]MBM9400917.1 lytic murein transglycosylase [Gluconacetobacter azotocaptans]